MLPSVLNANMARPCKLARKCLDKETREQLQNYFTLQGHEKKTRKDNYTLKQAKLKLRTQKNHSCLWERKYKMNLPLEVRKSENYMEFEKQH